MTKDSAGLVKKPDEMVKMRANFSETALKLSSILITKLNNKDNMYTIGVKEYKSLLNLKGKNVYEQLFETANELASKKFTMQDRFNNKFSVYNFISSFTYEQGVIEIEIGEKIKNYLLQIREKYLQYCVVNILALQSKYSIRIYELLKNQIEETKRYNKETILEISIDEFREIFLIPKSYKYKDIRIHILEKSQREINEKTDISFKWEAIKTGRKVSHIKFIITDNPKVSKKLQHNNKNKKTQEIYKSAENAVLNLFPEEIKDELRQVSDELIKEILKYLQEKDMTYVLSNIRYANKNAKDNYVVYLLKALQNDWAKNARVEQEEQNKFEQAKIEYQKMIGKTVTLPDGEYTVGESGIWNSNFAIPLGDILKSWEKWKEVFKMVTK